MSGHRQAALALYSLAESDQRAILAELPERDQKTLRAYLAELAELGFDKAANSAVLGVTPQLPGAGSERALLRAAAAPVMVSLLRQEPASFVACLLAIEPWPWAAQFIEQQTPLRRGQLADAGRAGFAEAPARQAFMLGAVAAALRELPAPGLPAVRSAAPSRLAGWLPWIR